MAENVNVIRLTDHKGILGEKETVYELDFSRESVAFAESKGFKVENVAEYPVTNIASLFYYAFRKNHRRVPRDKTDKLMEA